MRQRGDLSWATDLNAFRFFCKDHGAYSHAYERLKTRRSCTTCNDNPGGPIDTVAELADAPRLFPKTREVEAYNDGRLREGVLLIRQHFPLFVYLVVEQIRFSGHFWHCCPYPMLAQLTLPYEMCRQQSGNN